VIFILEGILWEEIEKVKKKRMKTENLDKTDTTQDTLTESRNEILKDTTVSGIYKIVNKINGKYYVGSSSDIHLRWKCHLKELRGGYHHNDYLQRSFNKYGEDGFEFIIIKSDVADVELLKEEQFLLDIANANKPESYNATFIAGRVEMTVETRKKIGLSAVGHKRNVGRKYSSETIEKRKQSRSWYKSHNQLTRKKISDAAVGRFMSEETKSKISNTLKGSVPHNLDKTILSFFNTKSGETFTGTKNDFIKSFGLLKQPVYAIINRSTRLKTYKGWSVVQS